MHLFFHVIVQLVYLASWLVATGMLLDYQFKVYVWLFKSGRTLRFSPKREDIHWLIVLVIVVVTIWQVLIYIDWTLAAACFKYIAALFVIAEFFRSANYECFTKYEDHINLTNFQYIGE
jgi:hypothetical protein